MFPTNPSKWYENNPNVEFTTDESMYDMAKKNWMGEFLHASEVGEVSLFEFKYHFNM